MTDRRGLAYGDQVMQDYLDGKSARFLHMGHWDDPLGATTTAASLIDAQASMNDHVLRLLDVRDGQVVLDVGCGFGGSLAVLAERHRNLSMIGVNIDGAQLSAAADLVPGRSALLWTQADAVRLPLADGSVDRVLCLEAMPHFSSRTEFLAEAGRVLRPDGRLAVGDILLSRDADAVLGRARGDVARELDTLLGPWPDPFWDAADIERAAIEAGLQLVESIDATEATRPTHDVAFDVIPVEPDRSLRGLLDAVSLMRRLHAEGALTYWYAAFRRQDR